MKHEPNDGAVLGATVCVEDGVPEALLVIDLKKYKDPKWKFFAESIEPGERPVDALKRGMREELGIDPDTIPFLQIEEMDRVPVFAGSSMIQHQYCVKLPRAVIDERNEKMHFTKEEHHYMRKFPLVQVARVPAFLPDQRAMLQTLMRHLHLLEPA